jgi:hypothetical protein
MTHPKKTSNPDDETSGLDGRVPAVYFEHFSRAEFIFRWENLISQDDGCSRNAHHVAVQLRSFMDTDGVCNVGIERLAREIKLDLRPTSKAIQELEDLGWVEVIREDNHSNRYFAVVPPHMTRAVQLLARERKGKTRHGLVVRATAPALVEQVLVSVGSSTAAIDDVELRRVVGRVRQLLTRTYDIEWEATQIVKWVLLEQPDTVHTPVGYILSRLATYGHTFKGRLSRDPRTAQIIDPAMASAVSDIIGRVAEQLSRSNGHSWLGEPCQEFSDPQMELPFAEP